MLCQSVQVICVTPCCLPSSLTSEQCRPLPEEVYGEQALREPLLGVRRETHSPEIGEQLAGLPLLERLLRCQHESAHQAVADRLWDRCGARAALHLHQQSNRQAARWQIRLPAAGLWAWLSDSFWPVPQHWRGCQEAANRYLSTRALRIIWPTLLTRRSVGKALARACLIVSGRCQAPHTAQCY